MKLAKLAEVVEPALEVELQLVKQAATAKWRELVKSKWLELVLLLALHLLEVLALAESLAEDCELEKTHLTFWIMTTMKSPSLTAYSETFFALSSKILP